MRKALAAALLIVVAGFCEVATSQVSSFPVAGRWDIVVLGKDGPFPSWIDIQPSGRGLVGFFVGRFGSSRPVARVNYRNGSVDWSVPPQWEDRRDDLVFRGRFANGRLSGWTTDEKGQRLTWSATRAPALKRYAPPVWGQPIELFNGRDLAGWKVRHGSPPSGWSVRNGLLTNRPPSTDLITNRSFQDFKLHVEFRYPKGSNSGIYLRGRYEMQIEDHYGKEPHRHIAGGIYGHLKPRENALKPHGEWQTVDITLLGRSVTITLNGNTVIDRIEIPGLTGGALDSKEGDPGPIMIQGDHGPIEFRKITITPALPGARSVRSGI